MSNMEIKNSGEYGELICRFFQTNFHKVAKIERDELWEILTELLVGTKEIRFGPKPKPEEAVVIRSVIRTSIDMLQPIPVLVPWGGRKMDKNLSLDIAELSAIKQLLYVDEMVRKFYTPGLYINIRIEDTGARWLYKENDGIDDYSIGLQNLVKMIKGDAKINAIRESELMDYDTYASLSEEHSELLFKAIWAMEEFPDMDRNLIPQYVSLVESGWKGDIPKVQRDYYISRYQKMYPGKSKEEYYAMLADYLAGSRVRYIMNGRAEPKTPVGKHIQITFAHPVPGAPRDMFSNTLYYRTVPESMGRTHIAPWRAKGYLEIVDDEVTPKVIHPGAHYENIRKNLTELNDGNGNSVLVRTDYSYTDSTIYMPATIM